MRRGTTYSVVSEPNPPEAIIRSVRSTRWVEVADLFWSDEWARDLYSYATPDEIHKPVPDGIYADTDNKFALRFVTVLSDKITKKTYEPFREQYGAGYLVLNVQYPFFNARTVYTMKRHWSASGTHGDRGCFRDIYIAFSSLNVRKFQRWNA